MDIRIGNGFDVHRLVPDRACVICGVNIPSPVGLLGHSDADVAIHALIDAIFGACAMGDLGKHFPDTDAQWEGADSRMLLRSSMEKIAEKGWKISNVDVTIIAQAPKMAPYIEQMRSNLAQDLRVDIERVSVKATTTERLGFTGRGEGIASQATALLYRP